MDYDIDTMLYCSMHCCGGTNEMVGVGIGSFLSVMGDKYTD